MNADPFSRDAFCPPLKDRVAQIDVPSNLFWKQIWSLKLHDDTMKLLCYYCVSCLSIVLLFAEALACRALWDWFVLSFENDLMVVKDLLWKIRAGNIDPLLTIFLDFQIIGDLQRKKRIMKRYIIIILCCYIYFSLLYLKWDLSCSVGRLKSSSHLHPLHSARGTLHLTSNLRSEPQKVKDAMLDSKKSRSEALSLETIKNHEICIRSWHLLASF